VSQPRARTDWPAAPREEVLVAFAGELEKRQRALLWGGRTRQRAARG